MAEHTPIPKPCGEYHTLPCGLDEWCEIPDEFFEVGLSNKEIWRKYQYN